MRFKYCEKCGVTLSIDGTCPSCKMIKFEEIQFDENDYTPRFTFKAKIEEQEMIQPQFEEPIYAAFEPVKPPEPPPPPAPEPMSSLPKATLLEEPISMPIYVKPVPKPESEAEPIVQEEAAEPIQETEPMPVEVAPTPEPTSVSVPEPVPVYTPPVAVEVAPTPEPAPMYTPPVPVMPVPVSEPVPVYAPPVPVMPVPVPIAPEPVYAPPVPAPAQPMFVPPQPVPVPDPAAVPYYGAPLKIEPSKSTIPTKLPPDPHKIGRGSNNTDRRVAAMSQEEIELERAKKLKDW